MLHFEDLTPAHNPVSEFAKFLHSQPCDEPVSPLARPIEMTFRSVELDGRALGHDSEDIVVGQLVEAIRLADLRAKSELNINDIAPWIAVGSDASCQVPILQKNIQRHLALACKRLKRAVPECRLDLSRGTYGIRCYLGRHKPTDHVYDEDFVSDSR